MYIDTHAHFDNQRFEKNRNEILNKIQSSSEIARIINCAITYESNFDMREKLAGYEKIVFSTGIHPNAIGEWKESEDLEREKELRLLAYSKRTVAIGETGLDYFRLKSDKIRQQYWFRKQIQLALDTGKPLILHIRGEGAEEEAIDILKSFRNSGKYFTGVLHCFNHPQHLDTWLDFEFYLGIGGMITREECMVKEKLCWIPLERIVLETDCPFIRPAGFHGKQNSSFSIPFIIQELAKIRNIDALTIENITSQNAARLFSLDMI